MQRFRKKMIYIFFFQHVAKKIITDYDDDPEQEETTGLRLTCSNRRPLGSIGYSTALRKAAALIQSVNIRVMSRVSGWDNSGIIHVNLCIHKVQLRRVAMHANEADGGRGKKKKRTEKSLSGGGAFKCGEYGGLALEPDSAPEKWRRWWRAAPRTNEGLIAT